MAPLCFYSFIMLCIFSISALPHSLNTSQQLQLLLQFKTAISNNNTSSLPDWTPLHPLCNWSAVTCDPSFQSVVALNLSDMNLDGTISPLLGNLSSLQSLDLSNNALTSTIPPQLAQLTHLQVLWVHRNQLQGTIPLSLSACRNLNDLALSYNQLHGSIPPELSLLTRLKFLYLGQNNLTGVIPPSFKNLSTLVELYLGENDLYGPIPSELGALSQLQRLSLSTNQLSGAIPYSLTNLSKLRVLGLSQNQLSGHIPREIGTKLSNLHLLSLWGNQLSGKIPNSLGNCSNLTALVLAENQLNGMVPMELGKLKLLTRLYLHTNQLVSDSSNTLSFLTSLTNCSHLQEILVSNNHLTGILPPSIGQLSSNLSFLDLSNNMISGRIPQQIANLTDLIYLSLRDNLFSGNIPSGIKRFQKLERLYLGGNKLEGSIPSEIGQMQHLGLLNFSHNQLSGKLPDSLCSPKQLRRLLLQHNNLSGEIPVVLAGCQNLELIDLSYNKLGGRIPPDFIASLKNLVFYLKLSWNSLEGSLPLEMSKIAMAQAIDISGNRLTGLIPNSLGDCTALEHLNLSHNAFEGPIPDSLSKLQNLQEMDLSTNSLSVGNFGSVYKGILRDGKIVAIKALNLQNEEAHKSFDTECKVLGRIRHRNLIKIISAFSYSGFKGLVLQFASNGSLEKHLHPDRDDQEFCKLGLEDCLSIAVDVAHGMEYLHHDCPFQIVHSDLKPSNVLLDANMTALVTDFGICRLITPNSIDSFSAATFALNGSIGYIAPEYGLWGGVSTKGDVYSYGILILEMVTKKRPSDDMFVGDMNLQKWVRSAFPDRLADIVDCGLLRDVNENMEANRCLLSFIHVGLLCSSESPRERPSIRDVARFLESLKTSSMGGAVASNLTATISDLLRNTNRAETLASDSQSSTF
ncbi:hypothetical protein SUGI_0302620 [Cryptomeria japonica]|nr:hypothetical protein SUGI_0302620 [Cryptomeria japonica]